MLSVGVVKRVDEAVLAVETDAVLSVVVTGLLAVVCDSLVTVVGVVVVSVSHRELHFHYNHTYDTLSHNIPPNINIVVANL